jgi:hypothetical protein
MKMEPYAVIDPVMGWVDVLYRWTPALAMLALLLGMVLFDGVALKKKTFFYPLLKVRMGQIRQFLARPVE